MTVVTVILVLCVLGIIAYAIQRFAPFEGNIKAMILFVLGIVAFLVLVFWLLGVMGIATPNLNLK